MGDIFDVNECVARLRRDDPHKYRLLQATALMMRFERETGHTLTSTIDLGRWMLSKMYARELKGMWVDPSDILTADELKRAIKQVEEPGA